MRVRITVRSRQTAAGTEEDIEQLAEGEWDCGEERSVLRYEENDASGMTGTLTTLTVGHGAVLLRREGRFRSRMLFREGHGQSFLYETPYGSRTLRLFTRRLETRLGPEEGRIEIDYELSEQGKGFGRCALQIDFRAAEAEA